jgi:hypothetical protein
MQVTVEFSTGLLPALEAWERTLSPDPVVAGRMADTLLDALKQRLIATEGKPADGFFDPTTDPREYWYELTGSTWVVYTLTDGGFFFTRWREVSVLGLAARPPGRAVPSTPRA